MRKLLNLILKLFSGPNYQERLERYILSSNPKTIADVDHLINRYNRCHGL